MNCTLNMYGTLVLPHLQGAPTEPNSGIEVFYMPFDRSLSLFSMTFLTQHMVLNPVGPSMYRVEQKKWS